MNASRRSLVSVSTLAIPALALAACTPAPAGTTTVAQILTEITGIMNYAAPIASIISIFVPGASAFLPLVESGLNAALNVANTIVSTMAAAAAQPLVQQVSTDLKGALTAAGQAIAVISDPTQQAKAQAILAQASQGVTLLDAFVTGVALVVTPPAAAARMGATLVPGLRIVTVR
jgi:hypothetical protein